MDKITVIKAFKSHGIQFKKGDVFYGRWVYASNLNKDKILPLVVACNYSYGPFLLPKENFIKND